MVKKIIISVGGTGGHLFPAQSIAKQIEGEGIELLFVGSKLSNNPYFEKHQFPYQEIEASSLSKKDLKNLPKNGLKILKGVLQSLKLIKKYNPDLIIGFGSYHTFPLLLAAILLRKKYILHEQNVQLGKVNKIFARYAKTLASSFPKTIPHLPHKTAHVAMPLRFGKENLPTKEEALKVLGLQSAQKTILVFGGSQGALSINDAFVKSLAHLKHLDFQVIHIAGDRADLVEIENHYKQHNRTVYLTNYESRMHLALKAADVIISRAGASTLFEQIDLEIPSIMIPYPYAGHHQLHNADYMEQQVKGGIKLLEKELDVSLLAKLIHHLLEDDVRAEYIENIQSHKKKTQTADFCKLIKKELQLHE